MRVEVHASPRARASRITGIREGALAVRLAAPPVDGAANEQLVELIARTVGLPRRDVSVVRGQTSRDKLVELRGLTPQEIRARLAASLETVTTR